MKISLYLEELSTKDIFDLAFLKLPKKYILD